MPLTAEQLAARVEGIGGSDAAAVAGVNPWASPLDIWLEKTGQATEQPDEAALERMHFGHVLEPIVAEEFSRRNSLKVQRVNATLHHREHPWMLCHLDRRIVGGGILECKTTGRKVEEPLEAHVVQVLHQLAVTGADFGMIAYLIGGQKYLQFRIERDNEAIEALIRIESAFWRHVQARTPPPPVNLQDVARLYPSDSGQAVIAPDGIVESCYTLAAARARIKAAEAEADAAELAIKSAMGDAATLVGPDGRALATWKRAKDSIRFNGKRFQEERPEVAAEYMDTVPGSRRFLLKTKEDA